MKKLLKTIGYDLLSYLIIFIILSIFQVLIYNKFNSLNLPESVFQLSQREISNLAPTIQSYYFLLIFLIIAVVLLTIIIWSISRALIWAILADQKIKGKYLLNAIPLGLLWFGLAIIPYILILSTFKKTLSLIALIIYTIILVYTTIILFVTFAKEKRVNIWTKSIKYAIKRYDLAITFLIFLGVIAIARPALLQINPILSALIYLVYFGYARCIIIEQFKRG